MNTFLIVISDGENLNQFTRGNPTHLVSEYYLGSYSRKLEN